MQIRRNSPLYLTDLEMFFMNKIYVFLFLVMICSLGACQKQVLIHDPKLDAELSSVKGVSDISYAEVRIYLSKTDGKTHNAYTLREMINKKPFRVLVDAHQIKELLELKEQGREKGRLGNFHPTAEWVKSKYIAHIYYIAKDYQSYAYAIIFFYKDETGKIIGMFFPQNADAVCADTLVADYLKIQNLF